MNRKKINYLVTACTCGHMMAARADHKTKTRCKICGSRLYTRLLSDGEVQIWEQRPTMRVRQMQRLEGPEARRWITYYRQHDRTGRKGRYGERVK